MLLGVCLFRGKTAFHVISLYIKWNKELLKIGRNLNKAFNH